MLAVMRVVFKSGEKQNKSNQIESIKAATEFIGNNHLSCLQNWYSRFNFHNAFSQLSASDSTL